MKLTHSQAECWIYEKSKDDNEDEGIFNGWSSRREAYLHYKCGEYFTIKGEKHRCEHWSKKRARKMREWKKYAEAGFASLFTKGYLKK